MKKRFLAIFLSVAMVCSAGCGDAKDVEQQESSVVETYEASSSTEEVSEESLGGKINSNTDTETSTTGHSTSSSEETDESFIPSSEWIQMMSDAEYYDEFVSIMDRTFNSDNLLMEMTYMDSINLSIKKSPEFMEMYMQNGDAIFSFAAQDTSKDYSKIYVQLTAPDENGNIQTLKQRATVSKDSDSGSFADEMLSDYTVDEDTLLDNGKESYLVEKAFRGETNNYCIKNLEDESLNTIDGYYMICVEKDGYIISMETALEEGAEPVVINITTNNVYFSEYDDSQYEEVSEEDILWTLFGGIMSIAMGASDGSDSFDLSFDEN